MKNLFLNPQFHLKGEDFPDESLGLVGCANSFTPPESAVGGPLGLVRTGDPIQLSVKERRVDVLVSDEDLARRRQQLPPPPPPPSRGYAKLYARSVLGAEFGCDFDFLRHTAV